MCCYEKEEFMKVIINTRWLIKMVKQALLICAFVLVMAVGLISLHSNAETLTGGSARLMPQIEKNTDEWWALSVEE